MTQRQRDAFHQLILDELREIKVDLKEVRQSDIPAIQQHVAVFDERLSTLKDDVRAEATRDARIYGGIGSGLAVLMSVALSWLKK